MKYYLESMMTIDNVDVTIADLLLCIDSNGKDCLLLAALSGISEVVTFIENLLSKASNPRTLSDTMIWTNKDIVNIANLIINGNETCLKYVFDYKIDYSSIIPEMNNASLAIIAAKEGKLGILDMLLSKKVDFSIQDSDGKTVFHYMTFNGKDISQLLLHENAKACNITEYSLAVADNNGDTPIHTAAYKGLIITVDLLAGKGMEAALQTKNKLGLTPLLIACSNINIDLVKSYLNLGSDAKVEDSNGHNALWHLYHPNERVVKSGRRTVAGEYYTKKSTVAPSKAERQAESIRLANDIELIQILVKAGCSLYQKNRNIENLLELKKTSREQVLGKSSKMTRSSVCDLSQFNKDGLEAGDIAVLELSVILFKDLPGLLSSESLWNLLLSSIIFDDGTGKCFQTLLEAGTDKKLAESGSFITLPDTMPNSKHILQNILFDGMTILGWAIRSGNNSVVQQLMRKNLSPTISLDINGNNGLHYAACYGQGSTVDMILSYEGELVRIEQPNNQNLTPVMMASAAGNYHSMKRLMAYGGDLRRGLETKYWGWLLVLARRQESNQKNLQWGRTGDDDERYFSISKDPFFVTWYKGTLPNLR
jgi:ankyrin repeat protein